MGPRISNKVSTGSFFCVVSSILSYGMLIYAVLERLSKEEYLDSKVVTNDDRHWRLISIVDLVAGALVVLLAIVAFVSACARLTDRPSSCLTFWGTKRLFTASLLGALVILGVWFVELCHIRTDIGYVESDYSNCNDYFRMNKTAGCISVSFVKNTRDRRLCNATVIKKFCRNYVEDIKVCYTFYQIGIYFIFVTLIAMLIFLSMNLTLARVEENGSVDGLQPLRF